MGIKSGIIAFFSAITFGLFGNKMGDQDGSPMKEQSSGGWDPNHLQWYKDPRGFRSRMEGLRRERLMKNQGLKYHDIDGLKIFALNKKNAERKFHNLIKKENGTV